MKKISVRAIDDRQLPMYVLRYMGPEIILSMDADRIKLEDGELYESSLNLAYWMMSQLRNHPKKPILEFVQDELRAKAEKGFQDEMTKIFKDCGLSPNDTPKIEWSYEQLLDLAISLDLETEIQDGDRSIEKSKEMLLANIETEIANRKGKWLSLAQQEQK